VRLQWLFHRLALSENFKLCGVWGREGLKLLFAASWYCPLWMSESVIVTGSVAEIRGEVGRKPALLEANAS
jgi:hypothetical protein